MRRVPIVLNTEAFRLEQRLSGQGNVPVMNSTELARQPGQIYILIGDRTPEFGGGLAATGYVMLGRRGIGTVSVTRSDVDARALVLK